MNINSFTSGTFSLSLSVVAKLERLEFWHNSAHIRSRFTEMSNKAAQLDTLINIASYLRHPTAEPVRKICTIQMYDAMHNR